MVLFQDEHKTPNVCPARNVVFLLSGFGLGRFPQHVTGDLTHPRPFLSIVPHFVTKRMLTLRG